MIGPRNVRPDELGDADGLELHDAMTVGNRLAEALEDTAVRPSDGFADAVMGAIATEPTPGATGFLVPLRRRGLLGGFRQSVREAWASLGAGRPILGRSAALAYVLAVAIAGISVTGAATLGAGTALGLFNATPTTTPPPATPLPTLAPTVAPAETLAPTLAPTESIAPTRRPTATPSETPEESEGEDDHGGNSGPGGGGDGGGSGSGSGDAGSGSGSDDARSGSDD